MITRNVSIDRTMQLAKGGITTKAIKPFIIFDPMVSYNSIVSPDAIMTLYKKNKSSGASVLVKQN